MKLKAVLPEHTGWELRGKHHPVVNFFKNFFVPHAGNSYEPHFLRPKRLFWYGLTSVAIKAVAVVFISFLPLYAWMTPDIMAEEANRIVALTNEVRATTGLRALAPNALLAEAAQKKTADMLLAQSFSHTSSNGVGIKYWLNSVNYHYLTAGENLAIGFSEAPAVVEAWEASPTHYRNLVGNFSEIGVAVVIGQYKGQETALVTQYLAQPSIIQPKDAETEVKTVLDSNRSAVSTTKKVAVVVKSEAKLVATTTIKTVITSTDSSVTSTVLSAQVSDNAIEMPPLEPVVLQTSNLDRYLTVRSHEIPDVRWLFSFSSWFYKLLLALAVFALMLNIMAKVKKQNIKLIGSSAAFICLMLVLLVV